MNSTKDKGKMVGRWYLTKFANVDDFIKGIFYDDKFIGENLLLNEGINEMWQLVIGDGGTPFDDTNSYLGVGDSTVVADATQTGLQAVTNKIYKGMASGYPIAGTDEKAIWRSIFVGSEANFDWQEFTVANGSSNVAKNMNRLVSNQGTKVAGQVWQLTLEITLS